MSRRTSGQSQGFATRRKGQIIIAAILVMSLFAAWTMLASSGALDSAFRQKGDKNGGVSIASFNSNSPSKEYIYAGGKLVASEEPAGCTAPSAPGTPTATALTNISVSVSWPASSGTVDHYQVERRNDTGSFAVVATVSGTSTSTTDTNGVIADTAYIYRISAFSDPSGICPSPPSLVDLATTTDFTVDPPVTQGNTIYATHLLRLRTAVNAVQRTAGLSQFDWGDSSSPGVTVAPAHGGPIKKEQVQKLRNRLYDARVQLGLAQQAYTNEPLTAGIKVFAIHILELRQGVQ